MRAAAFILFGALVVGCACEAVKPVSSAAGAAGAAAPKVTADKEKRQTQGEVVVGNPAHYVYRAPRRHQQYEQIQAVQDPQDDGAEASARIPVKEDYRPGQVFSIDARELLELQPERKSPYVDQHQLQQIYQDSHQQVGFQPSHAVIVRPPSSANGGEASVGAALSVSDSGSNIGALQFDRELLALLGHAPQAIRTAQPATQQEEVVQQQQQQHFQPIYTSSQNQKVVAVPYPQYISKPQKSKPTKPRPKSATAPPPPQQYLIETTNPQQLRQVQPQRPAQSLRYVALQPTYYERPEGQGLKIVEAPKLQPTRAQAYRFAPQPQPQPEGVQKQYRILQEPKLQEQKFRPEQIRYAPVDRPVSYLKRYQVNKQAEESAAAERYINLQQPPQVVGEQYYIRPVYRQSEQRGRYELAHLALGSMDATRALEPQQRPAAHSAIYVSKNTAPKKTPPTPRPAPAVSVEQHGESIEEQRAKLPPPRNNKAYTPEEFAALVAAGYSVTPVPVNDFQAQSRSAQEPAPVVERRHQYGQRALQYLPFRGDDAP